MKGFTTKAIHGGNLKKDAHNSLRVPLYDSVAFAFDSSQDIKLAFEGKKPAHAYSRITNPTVEALEQRLTELAGSLGAVAVSSGMAAIANTIIALAETGSNIVTSPLMFGNTVSLFEQTLGQWGLQARYVDMLDLKSIERAIDRNTRGIFIESITNPHLIVADIEAITALAGKYQVPVILDGTLTTPYLFRSKDYGVALEIISSTKYISGGATSVGGIILDNGVYDWGQNPKLKDAAKKYGPFALMMKLRREVFRNLGACLAPHNAWLQSLGLETLALRIEKSCENALLLAKLLQQEAKVRSVHYPGLSSSPFHAQAKKLFGGRYGGILTFELAGREACFAFMDNLSVIKRSTNLNDNKTLIIHPASTIFSEFPEEERARMQIGEGLIRLSVGIEDSQDLMEDLKGGLASI